ELLPAGAEDRVHVPVSLYGPFGKNRKPERSPTGSLLSSRGIVPPVKPRYILTQVVEAAELGLQEHWRERQEFWFALGVIQLRDLPRGPVRLVAVRPTEVEVVLVERRLAEEVLEPGESLQVEELFLDQTMHGFHIRVRI